MPALCLIRMIMQVIRNRKVEGRCFGNVAIAFVVAAHTCNALVMCMCMLAPPIMLRKRNGWIFEKADAEAVSQGWDRHPRRQAARRDHQRRWSVPSDP